MQSSNEEGTYATWDAKSKTLTFANGAYAAGTVGDMTTWGVDTTTNYYGQDPVTHLWGFLGPWKDVMGEIETVTFDTTFKNDPIPAGSSRYLDYWFYYATNLQEIDGLDNVNTSNVVDIKYMFNGCSSLTSLEGISNWDVSQVTSLNATFSDCSSLETLDLFNWDVSQVTSLGFTFFDCSSLETLDLSSWDVSQVTSLDATFSGCSSLETLNLSNWNTAKVSSMESTFANCSDLMDIASIGAWDVSGVTSLDSTFKQCSALKTVDLSAWSVPQSLQKTNSMFRECTSLVSANLPNLVSNPSFSFATSYVFSGCTSLQTLNLTGWDLYRAEASSGAIDDIFLNCSNVNEITLSPSYFNYISSGAPPAYFVPSDDYYAYNANTQASIGSGASPISKARFTGVTDPILFSKTEVKQFYTVAFNANGGTPAPASQTLPENSLVFQPATPKRAGYTLEGWYSDEALTQPWDFAANKITGNMTLYAKWERVPAKLTYQVNASQSGYGVLVDDQQQEKTSIVQIISPDTGTPYPVKAKANVGYGFVNWTDAAGKVVSTDASFTPVKPASGWQNATYTANFEQATSDKVVEPEQSTGGKIVMDSATTLTPGTTAYFHVVPDAGYELDGMPTVVEVAPLLDNGLQAEPRVVEVKEESPNHFSFTMPNFNVKIGAAFKATGPTPGPTPTPEPLPVPLPTPSENPGATDLTPEQQEEIIAGIDDIINGKVTEDQVDPYIKYIYDTYVKPYLDGKLAFGALPQFLQDYFRKNGILPKTGDMLGESANSVLSASALAAAALTTAAGIAARKRKKQANRS